MADSATRARAVVSFGEAMVRFGPIGTRTWDRLPPSAALDYLSTVGGDELNVCVDLALLGVETHWVSVVPASQFGDIIVQTATDVGVHVEHVKKVEGADVGLFFVIPEKKTVQYQRHNAAFAKQAPGLFDWGAILGGGKVSPWIHATGITPAITENTKLMWVEAMCAARTSGAAVSLDLNHRAQLGTLDVLMGVVTPFMDVFELVILSAGQIRGLLALYNHDNTLATAEEADPAWLEALQFLHARWGHPAVSCCFKTRDNHNKQKRWCVLVNDAGTHTTAAVPTWHYPKEECGGGSAWASGFIYGMLAKPASAAVRTDKSLESCLRMGDLLAAMCQESVGDHSTVVKADFERVVEEFSGREAFVGAEYRTQSSASAALLAGAAVAAAAGALLVKMRR